MENFESVLSELKESQKIKNLSLVTIKQTQEGNRFFFRFLETFGVTDVRQIGRTHIKDYLDYINNYVTKRGTKYAVRSICARVRPVKRLFSFLEEKKMIVANPAFDLKEPKIDKRLIKVILNEAQADRILDVPDVTTLKGLRDRTVLEVLYSTGIRLNELINLRLGDVDVKGGILRVNQGKGGKDRLVPLGQLAVRFVEEYISKVRHWYVKDSSHLFLSRWGKPLSKQVVEIMVRETAEKAGVAERITPHVFRHSFATQLVRNGADVLMVSKMLGHTRIDTTQIYVRAAGVDVKKSHQGTHPREKMEVETVSSVNEGYFRHV